MADGFITTPSLPPLIAQQVQTSLKNWKETAKSGDAVYLAEALNHRGELSSLLQKFIIKRQKIAQRWQFITLGCSLFLTLVCLLLGVAQVTLTNGLIVNSLAAAGLFCFALMISWLPWLIGSLQAQRLRNKNGNCTWFHAALQFYDQNVILEFLRETK